MATVWGSRGYLNAKQGKYEEALKDYTVAQKIYEKSSSQMQRLIGIKALFIGIWGMRN